MGKSTNLFIITFLLAGVVITASASPTNNSYHHDGIYSNQPSTMSMNRLPLDHGMLNGLNLSREQREQIRDIMSNQKAYFHGFDHNVLLKLHELIISDKFNENAVRQQLELNEKRRVNFAIEEARLHHQVYLILSPEQKQVFNQRFAQFIKKTQDKQSLTKP